MSPPRIIFRVDASLSIGTGHVMRCLTLADALHASGAQCHFVCREQPGHLLDLIRQRGHIATALSQPQTDTRAQESNTTSHAHWLGASWKADAEETRKAIGTEPADWLVVDHYALESSWERTLRPACLRLMVIDDLADRLHDCDLLLDQNLGRTADDYQGLLPPNATTLIGPHYALLRPEFAQWRTESLARRAKPELLRILVTLGGVDKDNTTGRVLEALNAAHLPPQLHITVVVGLHAPWLQHVEAQAALMNCPTEILGCVNNMAQLMAESDLAIGAAGGTSWERCCLGLPTVQLVLAANQAEIAKALNLAEATWHTDLESITAVLHRIFNDPMSREKLQTRSQAARVIADGLGSQRVINRLLKDV